MKLSEKRHMLSAALGRGLMITGALVAALTLQAQQSESQKSTDHTAGKSDTASCIKEAAQMNMGVIRFSQLASEKAQNPELKQFAAQLEKDHKQAQAKLEKIATKHNVTLPVALDQKCQEEVTKLQGLSGNEFDKEFAKGAVQGHAMAATKLQEASRQVQDSDLADYVKDKLAQVKEHQKKAREVAKAVGLDAATIASLETQPPEGVGTSGANSQADRGTSSSKNSDQSERKDVPKEP